MKTRKDNLEKREFWATKKNGDILHLQDSGEVWVDGFGTQRRTLDFGLGFFNRKDFQLKPIYAWHKIYRGECEKCHREGLYIIQKPYRVSKPTINLK